MRTVPTFLISIIWSTISGLVRRAIRIGLIQPIQLDAQVISVGNIQVGGAGKTPLVAKIANEANARGLKICILTRGYESQWERQGGVICPKDAQVDPELCGDEPALLHDLCPFAYIGVGADRERQFRKVLELVKKIDLVILDDGFQNWKIHKDLEVVALTSKKPWQVFFRDWRTALRSADLVVWTKGAQIPNSVGAPLVQAEYQLRSIKNPTGNLGVRNKQSASVQNTQQAYCLVTGIADSGSAYSLAQQAGYRIHRHLCFGDHAHYDKNSIRSILSQAQEAQEQVLVTGKDWVKWRALGVSATEVIVLEPELTFKQGESTWSKILWGE